MIPVFEGESRLGQLVPCKTFEARLSSKCYRANCYQANLLLRTGKLVAQKNAALRAAFLCMVTELMFC